MSPSGDNRDAAVPPKPSAPLVQLIPAAAPLAMDRICDRHARAALVGVDGDDGKRDARSGDAGPGVTPGHAQHDVAECGSSFGRLRFQAAEAGLDLYGWDADWLGARLFLNAITRHHDGALGGV